MPKNLLAVLPSRPKEWKLKFELQPTSFGQCTHDFCNILHLTNFCQNSSAWGCVGSQIPRFYYDAKNGMRLTISTASNGDGQFLGGSSMMSTPAIGAWTAIEMSEELIDGKYMVKQIIDGSLVHSWENAQPQSFENVSVYAYSAAGSKLSEPGFIRGLLIQGKGECSY